MKIPEQTLLSEAHRHGPGENSAGGTTLWTPGERTSMQAAYYPMAIFAPQIRSAIPSRMR